MAEAKRQARLLLGCYRTGDANDPEVYVAAVIAVLSRYPVHVMREVCDPVGGLPGRLKWLPTVAEVREACDQAYAPEIRAVQREENIRKQLAERGELSAPVSTLTSGRVINYQELAEMKVRPTGVFELGREISYRG